ncbi:MULTISPECIES: hypothetical protein [unclassified Pedobacter]|uniref:hypothetical protein n=1 Tax=unclassified Pedobacter TaxID=2628915 RepID=UPI000B4B4335|nr:MULTISPECIES: hypothetical protein [unclassified Pedobacter]MCX2432659.1 hypothetical protein [Pedobacter sp. GR22-10]NTE03274.1 hypothetical protein [Agrobacterium tumefaciens]NTE25156.1 hypothetical protein [Agrobacterium tumefaciens]OWK70097.1 hypothetical protein CBW18_14050 [Pedobacter sp. AJM]
MKTTKLEKRTIFIFKKNSLNNLTPEQMKLINGGNLTRGGLNLIQLNEGDGGSPSSKLCNDLKTQSI